MQESEIISFLRRVDKDDDGVISLPELKNFLQNFDRLAADQDLQAAPSSRRQSRKMRPLKEQNERKIVGCVQTSRDYNRKDRSEIKNSLVQYTDKENSKIGLNLISPVSKENDILSARTRNRPEKLSLNAGSVDNQEKKSLYLDS